MAKRKPSQRELSELRSAYLKHREELLIKKVDTLSVKLFDRIYNTYLNELDQSEGIIVNNDKNINLVKGLDAVYNSFTHSDNVPVIKGFVGDLQGITPLNERYFKNLTGKDVRESVIKVQSVVNKRIGVDAEGNLKAGGFADKFIRDKTFLKSIKRETTKAITNRMGFQEFRVHLKETIQGSPEQQLSGGLQQYYRNYAYDTFMRVDRLNQDLFAKDLDLRYFFWSGGVIKTSRPLCVFCNGKIVDSEQFKDLEYGDLKDEYKPGLNKDWVPLIDLGQFGCRHQKDFILSSVAEQLQSRWLDVNDIVQ